MEKIIMKRIKILCQFFEKVGEIDKFLVRIIKKKESQYRKRILINWCYNCRQSKDLKDNMKCYE